MKEHFQYMRVQFFIEVYKTCHSTLIQLDDNNLWKLDFIEFKVLPQTVMFWSLTASSFPQHSITLLTPNQSRCRVMKQEIVRKRNESISTIIIFICSSLENGLQGSGNNKWMCSQYFFAICWRTSDDFYSLSAWYRDRCSNLPSTFWMVNCWTISNQSIKVKKI